MHSPISLESDLIAALATPPGSSGVAVIRLSGPDLPHRLLSILFHPRRQTPLSSDFFEPRTMRLVALIDPSDRLLLDQVLVVYFPSPHSFTGEAQMEIQCHGSPLVTARILAILIDLGIRMAHPGEFSRRAYQNGKMDLMQAEALMVLIHASTMRAAREAARQLNGSLGTPIQKIRDTLLEVLAQVEAHLDFSDEDIEASDHVRLQRQLATIQDTLTTLLDGATWGSRLRQGFEWVIAGQPNVGKSTLYNLLVGQERAIVTAIPGTTRDLNEFSMELEGVPILLVDTAGLRQTAELVEQEGIRRAEARIEQADGIIWLFDATQGLSQREQTMVLSLLPERVILVGNKVDLCHTPFSPPVPLSHHRFLSLSCLNKVGFELLIERIRTLVTQMSAGEEGTIIMVARQRELIQRTHASVQEAILLLDRDAPMEIVAMIVRTALESIGEISGEVSHDHLLDHIFSTFCIGK